MHFTFIFCVLSLMLCPLTMLVSGLAPVGLRPAVFLVLGTLVCIPQGANNLCLVQMLLEVTPEKNRSLIVSLNMAFVTLSNAVMPFGQGVQLYNALARTTTPSCCSTPSPLSGGRCALPVPLPLFPLPQACGRRLREGTRSSHGFSTVPGTPRAGRPFFSPQKTRKVFYIILLTNYLGVLQ